MEISSASSLKLTIQTEMIKKSEEITKNQILNILNDMQQNLNELNNLYIETKTGNYINIKI